LVASTPSMEMTGSLPSASLAGAHLEKRGSRDLAGEGAAAESQVGRGDGAGRVRLLGVDGEAAGVVMVALPRGEVPPPSSAGTSRTACSLRPPSPGRWRGRRGARSRRRGAARFPHEGGGLDQITHARAGFPHAWSRGNRP